MVRYFRIACKKALTACRQAYDTEVMQIEITACRCCSAIAGVDDEGYCEKCAPFEGELDQADFEHAMERAEEGF